MGYWIYWAEKSELTYIKRWERFPSHPEIPVGDIVFIYDGSGIGWFAAAGQDLESCYKQAAFLVQTPFVMLHMELLSRGSLRTLMEDLPILAIGGTRFFSIDVEDGEWIMGTFNAGETARPINKIPTGQAALQMPLFHQLDTPSELQWDGPTEVERNTIERLTQGAFRNRLMQLWNGACCVTGVTAPHFLRAPASHLVV